MILASTLYSILRSIFFFIDYLIYSNVGTLYSVALKLYDINSIIDSSGIINRATSVVYSFLAVVMFFKLAFSLIEMLIDPSLVDDKQKGAGKLVLNILVMLVLVVVVPFMFKAAREIQAKVIEEQVVEKAIYGESTNDDALYSTGDRLSLSVWSVFLHPNNKISVDMKSNPSYKAWEDFFDAGATRNKTFDWDNSELSNELNETSGIHYNLKYTFILSTICGFYLMWIMLQLAIDVAYRSLKFLVLEIVSPIAIISYMNPKSSKDGTFAKWLKETISTYISLFIRIAVYALASVLLMEFSNSANLDANWITKIVYLLAVVTLIKSGPKLIDKIFGTELSKDSDAKMASKMLSSALGGTVAGIAGGVTGGISGAAVASGNVLQKAWGATKGAVKGSTEGIKKGWSAGGKDGLRGVVPATTSTYDAVRKDYGLNERSKWYMPDEENEISKYQNNYIPKVDDAKKNAAQAAKGNAATTGKIKDSQAWYDYTHMVRKDKSGQEYTLEFLYNSDNEQAYNAFIKGESVKAQNAEKVNLGILSKEGQIASGFKTDSSIAASMTKQIEAYVTSTFNRKMSMSIDEMRAELGPSAINLSVEDVQKEFTVHVANQLKAETGVSIDMWSTIAENAASDSKAADKNLEVHYKSNAGKADKRRADIYDAADGMKKAHDKFKP